MQNILKHGATCSRVFSAYNSWQEIAPGGRFIKGPFLLNERTAKYMIIKTSAGIFVLYTIQNGPPRYVGYDELDVRHKLLKWVGRSYRYFGFEYFDSREDAYHELCKLYHDHKKTLDNTRHPESSPGSDWRCFLCDASEKKERLGNSGRGPY